VVDTETGELDYINISG